MPNTFYSIILVQALVYLFVSLKKKHKVSVQTLAISALLGLCIGIPFDIILGSFSLYTYIPYSASGARYIWGLNTYELIINGILSYGLAVATAKVLTSQHHEVNKRFRKVLSLLFLNILIFSAIASVFFNKGSVLLMFSCGLFITSLGELLLLTRNSAGLFTEILVTWRMRPSLILWRDISLVGAVYEIANYFFPFWVWAPGTSHSRYTIEFLIIFFGYVALFHIMITAWRYIDTYK